MAKKRKGSGLGARRKSMTFGKMPSFAVFEKAFDEALAESPAPVPCYPMELGRIDSVTVAAAEDRPSLEMRGQPCYEAKELYALVKSLVAIWDSNIDAPTAQWSEKEGDEYQEIIDAWERADPDNRYSIEELRENAGSLASSIMETLGFEWI